MAKERVRTSPFDGSCADCGGPADAHKTDKTQIISIKARGGQYAVCALMFVNCLWEGHAYYVIDRDKEVLDPFAPPAPVEDSE